MVTFIGTYAAKIDDKGRVVLPAALKGCLPEGADMRFVVKKNLFDDCLEMFTFAEWERQSGEIYGKLNIQFNKDPARFWRAYMQERAIVEPDAKFGRISIPRQLLESIGATKEVVFSGNDFKIEIWDKDRFASSRISNEEFLAIADSLSRER